MLPADKEVEKGLLEKGAVKQVAKYVHGVGDSHNSIQMILGAGVVARIVRGVPSFSAKMQESIRQRITLGSMAAAQPQYERNRTYPTKDASPLPVTVLWL